MHQLRSICSFKWDFAERTLCCIFCSCVQLERCWWIGTFENSVHYDSIVCINNQFAAFWKKYLLFISIYRLLNLKSSLCVPILELKKSFVAFKIITLRKLLKTLIESPLNQFYVLLYYYFNNNIFYISVIWKFTFFRSFDTMNRILYFYLVFLLLSIQMYYLYFHFHFHFEIAFIEFI